MRTTIALFLISTLATAGALTAATPRVLGLSEAKVRSADPRAVEELRQAQKLMAQALFHMQQAEELQPGIGDEIGAPDDGGSSRATFPTIIPHPRSAPTGLEARLSRSTRTTRMDRGTDEVVVEPTKKPDADEERRKQDENYDRGKKGAGVLATTLKILSKIPIVKKFVPGHAGDVADAAGKVGSQMTKPRDGHANINGELKVWNEATGTWEDF